MGHSFDARVDAAWAHFGARLVEVLRADDEGYLYLTLLTHEQHQERLILIDWDEDGIEIDLHAHVAIHDVAAIGALGWCRYGDDDALWCASASREEVEVVSSMIGGGLRLGLGVADPAMLLAETRGHSLVPFVPPPKLAASPTRATSIPAPLEAVGVPQEPDGVEDGGGGVETGGVATDGEGVEADRLPSIAFAEDAEELRHLTLRTLRIEYGAELEADADGDYAIHEGVIPLWVRVLEDTPVVRVFSYVVRSVRDARQARIEIGILNRRLPLLKFTWDRGVIVATHDLLAAPFVGPQLLNVLDRISRRLDDLAPDLALRVGGQPWAEPSSGPRTDPR